MTDWRDISERAIWTFIQGALGAVTVLPVFTDIEGWTALAAAAATGGISALLSFLKTIAQERLAGFPDTRTTR